MENEHVLGGLIRKRSEIGGKIEHTQADLRRLVTELDAIDSAIRIFDPEADISAIRPTCYPPRHAAFRGEMMRFVMGALRLADGKPITTREIALDVMKGRGLSVEDAEMVQTIRKRVGACVYKLARDGHVRKVPSDGELKAWLLSQQ